MIYLVLLTMLTGGGYVEQVQEFKGSIEECHQSAEKHSRYSYCFQTTRPRPKSLPDASVPTR